MVPEMCATIQTTPQTTPLTAAPVPAARAKPRLRVFIDTLASPKIATYALIWLLVLLIAGTLAQRYIGLHEAQLRYFDSWFFNVGVVPIPGGRLTLSIIFTTLVAKFIFKSKFTWRKSGINITHLGVILILLGGFVTAIKSTEGAMLIPEGSTNSFYESYQKLELAVINTANPKYDQITAFSGKYIATGKKLSDDSFPGTITILTLYKNSELVTIPRDPTSDRRGAAATNDLKQLPLSPDAEKNTPGALIRISGLGEQTDGIYITLKYYNPIPIITAAGQVYKVSLRAKQYLLPFAITLDDFDKQVHPLHESGYTLYQSSFIDGPQQATVLAVVKNYGRVFPYISSGIICIGLLIQLLVMYLDSLKRKKKQQLAGVTS